MPPGGPPLPAASCRAGPRRPRTGPRRPPRRWPANPSRTPTRSPAPPARARPAPASTAARSLRRQVCGCRAIAAANSSAAARAWPGGTNRLTNPIAYASSAGTGRPVRIRSMARLSPISRGSRTVPPSISGTPQRRQNTPSVASDSATRRSHQSANSRPPATAYPEIAAITGLLSVIRVGPIGPSPSGSTRLPLGVPIALRSAPAQNVPPAPQSTATAASGSASKARKASASARAVGPSTAFRASARSRTTVVTAPTRSTRTPIAPACPSRPTPTIPVDLALPVAGSRLVPRIIGAETARSAASGGAAGLSPPTGLRPRSPGSRYSCEHF